MSREQLCTLWFVCALVASGNAVAQAQPATETVIHSFSYLAEGANPYGALFRDADGVLFGTADIGGSGNLGVVFELRPNGQYTVLHNFTGGADGANPYAGVTQDPSGNLYGTTRFGGAANAGVVYQVDPSGQETVLYSFTGQDDGGNPYAGVTRHAAGNLFGTANQGGKANRGVVYRLNPSGQQTVLHSFRGGTDGAYPNAGVILDSAGNLYGTTLNGGGAGCPREGGCGVVYKIDQSGQETVFYRFTGLADGAYLDAGVVMDSAGNLYGTAAQAGKNDAGVVYRLNPAGQLTVLYSFTGGAEGGAPYSGLVRDSAGTIYGTTGKGGSVNFGVAYELDPAGQETVLYNFPNQSIAQPDYSNANVILDSAGNLYGTTPYGGPAGLVYRIDTAGQETALHAFAVAPQGDFPSVSIIGGAGEIYGTSAGGAANKGAVFMLDAAGNETLLYSFRGGVDGSQPNTGLARDAAGNLYGTTVAGGSNDWGLLYKLDSSGHKTVLHYFTGGADGGSSESGVTLDGAGNLYGTTAYGGANGCGVVYKLDSAGTVTVLYTFTCQDDGEDPFAGVVRDSAGNLYGTAGWGGANGYGDIYKLDPAGEFTVLYSFPAPPVGIGGCNPLGA